MPAYSGMIRLLLVDDHALFRSGLKSVLAEAGDIEVVGEVPDGEAAIEFVRDSPPDVVLMDIKMPGIGGIEATRRILHLESGVQVIAVTALSNAPFPNRLLDAGALGYISKGCPADELFDAVRSVARGRHYLSSDVAQKLAIGKLSNRGDDSPLKLLSPREMQIMMMIVQGQGNQQISDSLFLSPKTISTYRHRLFEKLGVSNDVELTHFAIRHRLIESAL